MSKKPEKPNNSVYDLMNSIKSLTRSSLMFQNAIAEKMNLNITDAACINFLMETGPSTAGNLAGATGLTTGAITNVIDRLERAGFVKRAKDRHDRRKVIVLFIPESHEKVKKYYESLTKDIYSLFSGYSKKELKLLLSHSAGINRIYKQHVEEVTAG